MSNQTIFFSKIQTEGKQNQIQSNIFFTRRSTTPIIFQCTAIIWHCTVIPCRMYAKLYVTASQNRQTSDDKGVTNEMKPGIYETDYGNAAEVEDWNNPTAYDIDMAEEIPIECVTSKFIRPLDS